MQLFGAYDTVMLGAGGQPLPPRPTLRHVASDLSPEVCELLDRCLSVEASERPTAAELAAALRGAGRSLSSVRPSS